MSVGLDVQISPKNRHTSLFLPFKLDDLIWNFHAENSSKILTKFKWYADDGGPVW